MRQILLLISMIVIGATTMMQAQPKSNKINKQEKIEKITIDGEVVEALIVDNDTILIASLDQISVTTRKKFKNNKERYRYNQMRHYATKVYPYAVEAIKVFRELEDETSSMKKRKRRKKVKRLEKQLKDNFEDPLKNLTRTQGKILVKMIERETGKSMFQLLKHLKGGFKAFYWHNLSKVYGYDLKIGYHPEDDPMLESILNDLDISHKLEACD